MMPTEFHAEAEAEASEAMVWYETQQPGLGRRFRDAIEDAVLRIAASPEQFPLLESDVRRCLVKGFPYGIIYQAQEAHILVLSVMHLHRHPDYWQDRL